MKKTFKLKARLVLNKEKLLALNDEQIEKLMGGRMAAATSSSYTVWNCSAAVTICCAATAYCG